MNVAFQRPVPLGRPIRAEGWITERAGGSIDTAGRIVDPGDRRRPRDGRGDRTSPPTPSASAELQERYRLSRPATRRADDATAAGATAVGSPPATLSPVTARARIAFVADRQPEAEALGRRLAERARRPRRVRRALLNAGLDDLADPAYLEGQRRIAPGIGDAPSASAGR